MADGRSGNLMGVRAFNGADFAFNSAKVCGIGGRQLHLRWPLQVCWPHKGLLAPPGPTGPYRFRRLYESIQSLVAFTTFLGSMLGGQKVTNCC